MKTEVVKVQVALFSSVQPAPALVYDRKRRHEWTGPLAARTLELLGTDMKGYFVATWSPSDGWAIGERVADMPW